MKAFVILLFLFCLILCIKPKDKYKARWFYLMQQEEYLRTHNCKDTANQIRKMIKKGKRDENIAKYLDMLEASARSASHSNYQQAEINNLQSQIQHLQWQNQQLEWKNKYK